MSDTPVAEASAHEPASSTKNVAQARRVSAADVKPWLRSGVGMASTGVSLTLGILSLLFLAWPALKPEPTPAPAAMGAQLASARIEQGVELGSVYDRIGETPPESHTGSDLTVEGVVIGFDVVIDGFEGETLELTWSVIDATSLERVPEDWLFEQPGWPDGVFTAEAQEDRMNAEIWAPLPQRPGSYLVRISLYDPRGTRIAMLDTDPTEHS